MGCNSRLNAVTASIVLNVDTNRRDGPVPMLLTAAKTGTTPLSTQSRTGPPATDSTA